MKFRFKTITDDCPEELSKILSGSIVKQDGTVVESTVEFCSSYFKITQDINEPIPFIGHGIKIKKSKNLSLFFDTTEDLDYTFLIDKEDESKFLYPIVIYQKKERKNYEEILNESIENALYKSIEYLIPEKVEELKYWIENNCNIYEFDLPDDVYLLHKLNGDI